MADEIVGTILPDSDFGDPECCGCLNAIIRDGQARIVWNECRAVVRSVPAEEPQSVLNEMDCP